MAWFNNAIRDKPAGIKYQGSTQKETGLTSKQGEIGQGIERPFDVKFGPDGAMYIVDYGVHVINLHRIADGPYPLSFFKDKHYLESDEVSSER